jgi:hypothetical protein
MKKRILKFFQAVRGLIPVIRELTRLIIELGRLALAIWKVLQMHLW